jgi:hypothetical protein
MQGRAWAGTYDARDVIPLLPTELDSTAATLLEWPCRARRQGGARRGRKEPDVPSSVGCKGPYFGGGGGGLGVPVVS